MYSLSDFDFDLPQELIAQVPLPQRSASRLLHVDGDALADRAFADIVDLLAPGDLLVFNDTRVLKARFFGVKETGGKVEVLVERVLDNRTVHAQVRASKSPQKGSKIRLADAFDVVVGERAGEFYTLQFPSDVFDLIEAHGRLPLPPYIEHAADEFDEQRYQTVYAKQPGAVAAPTAGLHFDQPLLDRLRDKGVRFAYVTLHVGAGTFQPVRTENLAEHQMHSEWYTISQETVDAVRAAKAAGRAVIAVGTTSMRALESASQSGQLQAGSGDTALFITPGYVFKTVDRLITNFHLPKSTLLMLVSAFAGYQRIRTAYAHAIEKRYRFFSYGDAMLLTNTSC
ncbi:MAG TPA: tRNA preQ1(34) S-adenosylmethionine ribosyltransferase-isomerase QueA [Noviherbaspirillum sp.]|nr:tRNA preQ1(34) S-adenosylmethionine ribosyltransferase-isomerase QueA [Noviherbaspirillum sp.]